MKILRILMAFFQALLPLAAFGFISAVVYEDISSPYNIIIVVAIMIIGLFVSRSVFNMIRRRGVLEVMSGNNSSYGINELEITSESDVLKLKPIELIKHFSFNKVKLKNGTTISIWGDWEGRKLDSRHKLEHLEFDTKTNLLTFTFSENYILKVLNPNVIYLADSYLKIVNANEVIWQIPNPSEHHIYCYLNNGKTIETKSNTDWKPHKYDIGPGMDAVYLQLAT